MAETQPVAAPRAAEAHVPAWKRIGLKLKYAREEPLDEATTPNNDANTTALGKRERERIAQPSPVKRAKRMSKEESTAQTFETPAKRSVGSDAHGGLGSAQLRKSVSFTPDTKQVDGISASNFFKAWQAERADHSSTELDSSPATAMDEQQSPLATKVSAKKKDKKTKKKKQKSKAQAKGTSVQSDSTDSTSASGPTGTPDYVEYLLEFTNDKDHWKFNKKKQSELLKHFFDLKRIPSHLNQPLVLYVSGLQGASAQQRLLDQAEDILRELLTQQNRADELDGMESRAARKTAYDRALQREFDRADRLAIEHPEWMEEQIRKHEQSVEKGKRAEAVLKELLLKELRPTRTPANKLLGPEAQTTSTPASSAAPTHFRFNDPSPEPQSRLDSTAKRKKTRKSRTDVSSSSSDDSSDSDSSDDDAKVNKAQLARISSQQPSSRMYARRSPGEEAELRHRAKLAESENSDQTGSSEADSSSSSDSDSDSSSDSDDSGSSSESD